MKFKKINDFQRDSNGNLVDFEQLNKDNHNPLMHVLYYNIKLTAKEYTYLLKNTKLKRDYSFILGIDSLSSKNLTTSPLMRALRGSFKYFSNEHWDYLIKNSDLNIRNIDQRLPFDLIFRWKNETNFTFEQLKFVFENSNFDSNYEDLEALLWLDSYRNFIDKYNNEKQILNEKKLINENIKNKNELTINEKKIIKL